MFGALAASPEVEPAAASGELPGPLGPPAELREPQAECMPAELRAEPRGLREVPAECRPAAARILPPEECSHRLRQCRRHHQGCRADRTR